MGVLRDTQLARMREIATTKMMPETCTVPRETPGAVNPDGSTEPGAITTLTYPCRVGPLGGSPMERVIAERLQSVSGFVVTLPWDADINERDTIHWNGQVLDVLGVLNPRSYEVTVRVACSRTS